MSQGKQSPSMATKKTKNGLIIKYHEKQFAQDQLHKRYSNIVDVPLNKGDDPALPPPPPGPPPVDIVERYSGAGVRLVPDALNDSLTANFEQKDSKDNVHISVPEQKAGLTRKDSEKEKHSPSVSFSASVHPDSEAERADIEMLQRDKNYRPSIVSGLDHNDEMFSVKIDRYGFPTEEELDEKTHRKMLRKENERLTKWQNMIFSNKKGKMHELSGINPNDAQLLQWQAVCNHRKLKSRIRKGIPQQLRALMWQNLAGARERRKVETTKYNSQFLYSDLVQKAHSPYKEQLWKDINRTFRTQVRFGAVGLEHVQNEMKNKKVEESTGGSPKTNGNLKIINDKRISTKTFNFGKFKVQSGLSGPNEVANHATEGQQALYNVLKAFSLYRQDIGYCQGMQAITALLLMHMTEEEAFWVLASLADSPKYQMENLWRPSMPAIQLRFYQMERYVRIIVPKLAQHFEKIGIVSASMYQASQWFITIFLATSLGFETITRIFDIYMAEGLKTIFRCGLGILKYYEKDLLKSDFEDIMELLQRCGRDWDVDEYIEKCFSFKITHKQLEVFEKDFYRMQQKEKQGKIGKK